MAYSGDPADSTLDELRFLLFDTGATELMSDSELNYLLGVWADVYQAARTAAQILSAKFAQTASTSKRIGDLWLENEATEQSARYARLAEEYASMGARASAPNVYTDADATPDSAFTVDQFDND